MRLAHSLVLTRRFWLVVVALAFGGLVFAPWYVLFAVQPLLPRSFVVVPWWYQVLFLYTFASALSFSRFEIYVLVSLLGVVAVVAAWQWSRPNRIVRGLFLVSLLSILAFPWLFRYQPALVAAPGYAMRLPTQPGWLDGVVKSHQAVAEVQPCAYTLLGWSNDAVLYYQAACKTTTPQTWVIAPDREASPRLVDSAPPGLSTERAPTSILDWVRAEGVRPASAEPDVRRVHLREGSLMSPDGRWVALIARHVYGPEDVVLVSPVE